MCHCFVGLEHLYLCFVYGIYESRGFCPQLGKCYWGFCSGTLRDFVHRGYVLYSQKATNIELANNPLCLLEH